MNIWNWAVFGSHCASFPLSSQEAKSILDSTVGCLNGFLLIKAGRRYQRSVMTDLKVEEKILRQRSTQGLGQCVGSSTV